MGHRRGVRRAFTKSGVKNQIWSVLLVDQLSVAAGSSFSANIVQASDWAALTGQRATMMAMRGYVSISGNNSGAAKAEGALFGYIGVLSEAAAATPPAEIAATYTEPTILTTFGHAWEDVALGVTRNSYDVPVNLKTKRTINTSDNLVLVMANESLNTIEITSVIRTLMRKND